MSSLNVGLLHSALRGYAAASREAGARGFADPLVLSPQERTALAVLKYQIEKYARARAAMEQETERAG